MMPVHHSSSPESGATPGAAKPPPGQRGFALLIVLWAVVFLAFLISELTAAGRLETHVAANLRSAALSEAAADGAVYEALFHLLDGSPERWAADNSIHRLSSPNGFVLVRIQDEEGKINPNTASFPLLAAVLRNVGADPQSAAAIASNITIWRSNDPASQTTVVNAARYRSAGRDYGPPGASFQSLDELGLVLGVSPELFRRLLPHLSIYSTGSPTPATADPVVKKAITEIQADANGGLDTGPLNRSPSVSITAEAHDRAGSVFTRSAVIRLEPAADGRPYQILTWEAPDA